MSEQDFRDCNLLVVAAVEGYAHKYNLQVSEVINLFNDYNVITAIRSQYPVLHMLDLDEAEIFAEDILKRKAS